MNCVCYNIAYMCYNIADMKRTLRWCAISTSSFTMNFSTMYAALLVYEFYFLLAFYFVFLCENWITCRYY